MSEKYYDSKLQFDDNNESITESIRNYKIELQINYKNDFYYSIISSKLTINKLKSLVLINFSDIENLENYMIYSKNANLELSSINQSTSLEQLLLQFPNLVKETQHLDKNMNQSNKIELDIIPKNYENANQINFKVLYNSSFKLFSLPTNQSFERLKIIILSNYPDLEDANYSIEHNGVDLTSIHTNNKLVKDIFNNEDQLKLIILQVSIKPKHFVKYVKKCSVCSKEIATKICVNCTIAYCEICLKKDHHFSYNKNSNLNEKNIIRDDQNKIALKNELEVEIIYNRLKNMKYSSKNVLEIFKKTLFEIKELNFIIFDKTSKILSIDRFSNFENTTLKEFEKLLGIIQSDFYRLDIKGFTDTYNKNMNSLNTIVEDNFKLLNNINDMQVKSLNLIIDKVLSILDPLNVEDIIGSISEVISKYKLDPFFDCEEAMIQLNLIYVKVADFFEKFIYLLEKIEDIKYKFETCIQINNSINSYLTQSFSKVKTLFNNNKIKFSPILKVFDNERVLKFDYYTDEKNEGEAYFSNSLSLRFNDINFYSKNNIYNNMFKQNNKINQNCLGLYNERVDRSNNINNNFDKIEKSNQNFSLMQFIDDNEYFKRNFNNFVQVNFKNHLFVVTGSNTQKLFFYNLKNNEMKFINNLLFAHNWWPALILTSANLNINDLFNESINLPKTITLKLLCLSGSYTKKCEELVIKINVFEDFSKKIIENFNNQHAVNDDIIQILQNLNKFDIIAEEWKEIPDIITQRGQAASCIVNNKECYMFYGYNNNNQSVTTIEKYDGAFWENVPFSNSDSISSLLYYHSTLILNVINSNDKEVFIFGGLKEVDMLDNIYSFNIAKKELKMTKLKNVGFYKFQNEKKFNLLYKDTQCDEIEITSSIYGLFDNKNNVHIFNENTKDYQVINFSSI